MTEGIYELHWQRREYGALTVQLYFRGEDQQLRMVHAAEQGPFSPPRGVLQAAWVKLLIDLGAAID